VNLCDSCTETDRCPERGSDVLLCVEYCPRDPIACRAAQIWHAGHNDRDHWCELCRLIDAEQRMKPA
jgi:hypothetical protein